MLRLFADKRRQKGQATGLSNLQFRASSAVPP
jgi:hypothetical protein